MMLKHLNVTERLSDAPSAPPIVRDERVISHRQRMFISWRSHQEEEEEEEEEVLLQTTWLPNSWVQFTEAPRVAWDSVFISSATCLLCPSGLP